jgi:aldose 1-epimerase
MLNKSVVAIFIVGLSMPGSQSISENRKESGSVTAKQFGKLSNGREVTLYTLHNKSGATVTITNLGAALVSINVPDRKGVFGDVLLGHDDAQGYANDNSFLGFIVGRYGNRIGKGKFSLNGKNYQLDINDGENHLHGGKDGFHRKLWKATVNENSAIASITMRYFSPDGEQGYPGNVTLDVTYRWNDNNQLTIEYVGTTDEPTILNPTSHGYFNLTGNPKNTVLDHELMIVADRYTPVGAGLITTGKLESVEGTPLDFRAAKKIGAKINEPFEQLQLGKGYDHNWVLNSYDKTVRLAATVYDPQSGRFMEVLTDQPGLQFYSGNFLNGSLTGKMGIAYQYRTALCLEAQHFPDSPNKPGFPSVVVRPGEMYRQTTIYQFSTK